MFIDAPISDNAVSTTTITASTCHNGNGFDTEWIVPTTATNNSDCGYGDNDNGVVGGGFIHNHQQSTGANYSNFEIEDQSGMIITVNGSDPIGQPRSKNVFKNNFKAFKSGLKTAATWLPNMFNKSNRHRHNDQQQYDHQSKTTKSSKTKLSRNDSISSSLHSNSYYSSVLGSENSNSQYTNNSYSTNGSQQQQQSYGQQQQRYSGSSGGTATITQQQQQSSQQTSINRCNSYDPISIDGSSRRSSEASLNSIAAATMSCNHNRSQQLNHHQPQNEPKHLKQTDNLVIQPQSLALSHDQQYAAILPPPQPLPLPPSNMIVPFSPPSSSSISSSAINQNETAAQQRSLTTSNTATATTTATVADEPIIFPDEMVNIINHSALNFNYLFFVFFIIGSIS